eukprot:767653-Hanusia_phi.AAC.1
MEGPYVSLAEFMAAERMRALIHSSLAHSPSRRTSVELSHQRIDQTGEQAAARSKSHSKRSSHGGPEAASRSKSKSRSKSFVPPSSTNKCPPLPSRSTSAAAHYASPPRSSNPSHDSTFALTATPQAEVHSPNSTFLEPLSPLLMSRPATCISMATTMSSSEAALLTKKSEVKRDDKASQCSLQDMQEIEGTLRRYFFSYNPSQGSLIPYLHSDSSLSRSPARTSEMEASSCPQGADRSKGLPEDDRYRDCWSSLENSQTQGRLRRRAGSRESSKTKMYFYEVMLKEDRTFPNVDYSTDFRRFSYTDFKVPDDVGRSNISPEAIAEWISLAHPRNQDDVYPLLVLCKDLVRKYHQREVFYTVNKEVAMREQIDSLTQKLQHSNQRIDALNKQILEREASYTGRINRLIEESEILQVKVDEAEALKLSLEEARAALNEERARFARLEESLTSTEVQVQALLKKEKEVEEENTSLTRELRNTREKCKTLDSILEQEKNSVQELKQQVKRMSDLPPDQILGQLSQPNKLTLLKLLLGEDELVRLISRDDLQTISSKTLDKLLMIILDLLPARSKNSGRVELGMEGIELFNSILELLSRDEGEYKKFVGRVDLSSSTSRPWTMMREGLRSQGKEEKVVETLKLLLDIDELAICSRLFGVSLSEGDQLEDMLGQFKRWYEGRGKEQAVLETDEAQQKRQKYNLFDMTRLNAEPLPLTDTLRTIGEIIDFKFEADYENESEQRPRTNLVKTIRSFMVRKYVHKQRSDEQTRRLCAAVLQWQEQSSRVRIFGICSGMLEVESCWTERSICVLMLFWQQLKMLDEPGAEALEPEQRGENWSIFAPWLGDRDRSVGVDHVRQSVRVVCDSAFAFGPMEGFEEELGREEEEGRVSLDRCSELFMNRWFEQLEQAKRKLRELFVAFDVNHDETLEISEFIQLLRATPMRIRQHDAINLFNELAGPDDTMDEEEFAEILVFYKFNTRHLLSISTER